MVEQLSMFETDEREGDCCYQCEHFCEFKEPRTYTERGGEFTVFGMCAKGFCKNGSYYFYPIYVPLGKCNEFKKNKKLNNNKEKENEKLLIFERAKN